MYSMHGAQQIYVYSDRRIIKSSAVGQTNIEEIQWLGEKIIDYAKDWKACGWGYVVVIGEMKPVSPQESKELIELHKRLELAGCKSIAFVQSDAFVIGVQANKHQRKSKVSYKEKHFRTEEEALEWIDKMLE